MKKSGFTIVELLIVIVVIGILAAITVVAFNGVQTRARDTERATDMATIKKALELFHVENDYYPSTVQMTNATWRQTTLKLPADTTRSPTGANISYCWPSNASSYCYVPYRVNGATANCIDDGERCLAYTLSYRTDADPTTDVRIQSAVNNR